MDGTTKQRWVDALRSGVYTQGTNWLNADGKHCCLGVLCELAVEDGALMKKRYPDGPVKSTVTSYVTPENVGNPYDVGAFRFTTDAVYRWIGSEVADGRYAEAELFSVLAAMNDGGDADFNQIADYIEKHVKVAAA